MDKRFVTFILLAVGLLMLNMVLTMLFVEGPPQAAVDKDAKVQSDDPADDGAPPVDASDDDGKDGDGADDDPVDGEPNGPDVEVAPAPKFPLRRLTLGSVDPASEYKMGITLTSRGAAVERVELSDPRYRDIEDLSGYLGHLAATDANGGARVNVVVPGTPAEKVGIEVGDVITAVGKDEIDSATALQKALGKTRPRRTIKVTYRRGDDRPKTVEIPLTRRPLEIIRPEIENYQVRKVKPPKGFEDPPSFLLTLEQLGDKSIDEGAAQLAGIDLYDANWEVLKQDETEVAFRLPLPKQQLEFIKRYRMKRAGGEAPEGDAPAANAPVTPGYDFDYEVEVRNLANKTKTIAIRQDGPNGLPIEGWWYGYKIARKGLGGAGIRDVFVQFLGSDPSLISASSIAAEDVEETQHRDLLNPLLFAGGDAKYFSAIMIPRKAELTEQSFQYFEATLIGPKPDPKIDNVTLVNSTCRLVSETHELEAAGGAPLTQSYQVFAGPKSAPVIDVYGQLVSQPPGQKSYTLESLIYFGWRIWAVVAWAMTFILHLLYSIVPNYGIAIILLTVCVRGCMFPLSKKQALNMIKMQELQPEIKKIAEKYKNDMEKRTRAQQELFRKHNYHPMGGCLVMFLQLPIFLGLYRALMVDIELRDAPLISNSVHWCSNLAAPDMLWNWSGVMPEFITQGTGMFVLGPYLNILPLVTVALFIMQQKMFMPPPADEQAAMQQKIMKYMMVFMGLIFYKVASGLCIYFIASTLWGMAERKLLPKSPAQMAAASPTTTAPPTTKRERPSTNGQRGKKKTGKKKSKRR